MNDTEQFLFYTGDYVELMQSEQLQDLSTQELKGLALHFRTQIENIQEESLDTQQVIREISNQIFGSCFNSQHTSRENPLPILEANLNNVILELSNRRKKSS